LEGVNSRKPLDTNIIIVFYLPLNF
jgi:hypothetical protein